MKPLVQSVIAPTWRGETAAILTLGPSVEGLDLSLLDACKVVAINNAWRLYPRAHTALGGDYRYFRTVNDWHNFQGKEIICLSPEAWRNSPVSDDPRAFHIGRGPVTGLATNRAEVSGRRTCVTQAMSYLAHRGVAAIILAGIDLKPSPDGRRYAFSDEKAERWQARDYRLMYENFKGFVEPLRARGIRVYNVSKESRLCDFWSYTELKEAVK